jgi:hypothetical protein
VYAAWRPSPSSWCSAVTFDRSSHPPRRDTGPDIRPRIAGGPVDARSRSLTDRGPRPAASARSSCVNRASAYSCRSSPANSRAGGCAIIRACLRGLSPRRRPSGLAELASTNSTHAQAGPCHDYAARPTSAPGAVPKSASRRFVPSVLHQVAGQRVRRATEPPPALRRNPVGPPVGRYVWSGDWPLATVGNSTMPYQH